MNTYDPGKDCTDVTQPTVICESSSNQVAAAAVQVTVVPNTVSRAERIDPPLTVGDLPLRLAAPVVGVANATGLTLESAALLVVTHLATWTGERSGCYTIEGGWVPAAMKQLVVFPDSAVMARTQTLLTDEFTRLEDALRQEITRYWDQLKLPDRVIASQIDPSGKSRRKLQQETFGWVTWLRNPDAVSFRQGTRNAYRQALTTFIDDITVFEAMLADKAPPQSTRLLTDLHSALVGGHVFQTRAELNHKEITGKSAVGCIKASLLGHVAVGLGERLVRSTSAFATSWLKQALVWAPEYDTAPGRIPEPARHRWHAEWGQIHHLTTQARMRECGTTYLTVVAAEAMMAWELEARAIRDQLPGCEREFVHWAETLPYRLMVPLKVNARNGDDSAGGFARLAVRLTRYAIRNALQFYRRIRLADTMVNDPEFPGYIRELVARGYQHWPSLAPGERDALAVACFAAISGAFQGAPGFPRSAARNPAIQMVPRAYRHELRAP